MAMVLVKCPNCGDTKVEKKKKIIEMAINGSDIRDTARVLKISIDTVIDVLKKRNFT